jgi:hypothetical protein
MDENGQENFYFWTNLSAFLLLRAKLSGQSDGSLPSPSFFISDIDARFEKLLLRGFTFNDYHIIIIIKMLT